MILDVTAEGLVIPAEWLGGIGRVDLRREDGRIVLVPVVEGEAPSLPVEPERYSIFDPIHGLGANPVDCGVTDGSINLDEYVYGDPHRLRS